MNKTPVKRKKKLKLLYPFFVILLGAIMAINIIKSDTAYLKPELYTETAKGLFYVFKNEDYRVLLSDSTIAFSLPEGEKIGANTVLSANRNLDLSNYIQQKINAVDYLLAHREYENKADIYSAMIHTKTQLSVIDDHLTQAITDNDSSAKETLSLQREEKQTEYITQKTALLYVHLSVSDLNEMKSKLIASLGSATLTPYNLNLFVYGNIYYSLDGYENYLNLDNLDDISNEFFDKVDKITYSFSPASNEYYLKSTATDKIILISKVNSDKYFESEYDASALTERIYTQYDISEGFYNFLYRQVSILNAYPSISFEDGEDNIVEAKLINVVYDGKYKYMVMCVRDNFSYFMQKRIFTAQLTAEEYYCYIVPSTAITKKDGTAYLTVMDELKNEVNIEVKIYKNTASKVYLKANINKELRDYEEYLIRGKDID